MEAQGISAGRFSHRSRLAPILVAVAALVSLAIPQVVSAAPKQIVSQIGTVATGEAGGRFNLPQGVAVNQTGSGGVPAGTFYVADSGNRRVQRFGPTGTFVSAWGWGVAKGNEEFELCTEAPQCRKGSTGFSAGQFDVPQGIAVDQSTGNVYVGDPGGNNRRINVFSAKGTFQGAFGLGVLGDFSTELQFCTTETECGFSFFAGGQGGGFPEGIGGLTVSSTGDVYVANPGYRRVDVFRPVLSGETVTGIEFVHSFGWGVNAGNEEFEVCTVSAECKEGLAGSGVGQFATGSPTDVAVDSEGHVFALDAGNKRVQEFSSVPAPIGASFGAAALAAVFGPDATLFNLAVDPSLEPDRLLVSGAREGSDGKVAIVELDQSGANALGAGVAHGEDLPVTSANGLAAAAASIGGSLYLTTNTVGILRGIYVLNEAPTVEPVTEFTGTTAVFKGRLVSNGIGVTYHFEYSVDGESWIRLPGSDVNAGAAPGEIEVEQEATGLSGSQTYRFRLVQNRAAGGGIATSSETTFTTLAERPAITGTVASNIGGTRATFNAYLDPQNQTTTYRFEYGLADCSANPCAALPSAQANGGGARLVSQSVAGLEPGKTYHFRLVATNATGTTAGPDATFETTGVGANLPDNRAYELVTPPDTGSVVLNGNPFGSGAGSCFDIFPVTPDGNSVVTASKGGSLPGLRGNGVLDLYESVRGADGWTTISKSTTGAQSAHPSGGICSSPAHFYSNLRTGQPPIDEGEFVVGGEETNYIRRPDGSFELVGLGEVGAAPVTDPRAEARWIADAPTHIIFTSRLQLDDDAPPSGVESVYDRPPGSAGRLLSSPPTGASASTEAEFENQDARYQGASVDGSTVAFMVGSGLYVARAGATTPVTAGESAAVGTTLTCRTFASATTVEFRWLRNGAPIAGAEDREYTAVAADAGAALQCQVVALESNSGSTQVSTPAVTIAPSGGTAVPKPPSFLFAPEPFEPSAGTVESCETGSWEGEPSFTYQWYVDGVAVPGATAATYEVQPGDVPGAIQCAVTGTNAGGSATVVSAVRETSPAPSPEAPFADASTGEGEVVFGGLSRSGERIFYEQRGNLFAFDLGSEATTQIAGGGGARFVNVSEDGGRAYFVAPAVLTGAEENGQGQQAEPGERNLYVWDHAGGEVHFVAILAPQDNALTSWTATAVSPVQNATNGRGNDPSRTTPDGSVIVFESQANLTDYDSDGHAQIYRYGVADAGLDCVSCPAAGPTVSDARLQMGRGGNEPPGVPVNSLTHIQNVTDDGGKVFFQTQEALVPADVNSTWDVYEWKLGQQAYLISSGVGPNPSFLYAMTPTGSDVFFSATERLVPRDLSSTASIYDARVNGGFVEPPALPPCQDSCQGTPSAPPQLPSAGSNSLNGPGNLSPRHKKHKKKKHKKKAAHKKHKKAAKKQGHHKRANHDRRTGR